MSNGIRLSECRPFEGGASVIAATLEEDIVLGLLAPKVRLVEDELIGRFGAKRHHVREALVLLEALGLVERKRNIGAQVKAFSREEVIQLYEMRELLEVEAMRKFPLPVPTQPLQVLMQPQHPDTLWRSARALQQLTEHEDVVPWSCRLHSARQ